MKTCLILPVRGRVRTEIVGRRVKPYEASVAQQWTTAKGPASDTTGGVTIRPLRCASFRILVKHWVMLAWLLILGARLPVTDRWGGWWCRLWKMARYADR